MHEYEYWFPQERKTIVFRAVHFLPKHSRRGFAPRGVSEREKKVESKSDKKKLLDHFEVFCGVCVCLWGSLLDCGAALLGALRKAGGSGQLGENWRRERGERRRWLVTQCALGWWRSLPRSRSGPARELSPQPRSKNLIRCIALNT